MSVIEDYKLKNEITMSEDIFDISRPPEFQCKKIDDIVDRIKTVSKLSSKFERMDEDELKDALFNVNWEIDGMDKEIEELRTAIEDVRQWGQEWKEFSKDLIEKSKLEIEELI